MFFKISKELAAAKKLELANKEKINCFSLSLIHNKNMYSDVLFLTVDAAQELAHKHANENPRLKVRYVIKNGLLHDSTFISGHNTTVNITGEKVGKIITWNNK